MLLIYNQFNQLMASNQLMVCINVCQGTKNIEQGGRERLRAVMHESVFRWRIKLDGLTALWKRTDEKTN